MKNIRRFSDFLLKESQEYPQLPKNSLQPLIEAIKSNVKAAVKIYSTFRKSFPNWLNELNNEASKEGTTVENILDDHFKKDPSLLNLLDEHPEIKKEVISRTGTEDFSKIGRLGKLGII